MKRILFAWELGKATGHVTQLVDLARVLLGRGWEVRFALRDPEALRPLAPDLMPWVQPAPHYQPTAQEAIGRPLPVVYSDELLGCGWRPVERLAGLVRDWQAILANTQPTVLLAQAAPTALLAARGRGLITVNLGRGYDVPPLSTPMWPLAYWKSFSLAERQAREDLAVAAVNDVLQPQGLPPVADFASVLRTDLSLRCDFAELSHYPPDYHTEPDAHLGPFFRLDQGDVVHWLAGFRHRILVYLQGYMPGTLPTLLALHRLSTDHDIVFVCPGMPPHVVDRLRKPNIRLFGSPVRFDLLLPECALVINYASAGVTQALPLFGVPVLALPVHVEQWMVARALERIGMGRALETSCTADEVFQMIRRLLETASYRRAAMALGFRYRDHDPGQLAHRIADRIEAAVPGPT